MNNHYNHTQTGHLLLYTLGACLVFIGSTMFFIGFHWVSLFVMFILGTIMFIFSTLNVSINDEYLEIRFGLGLIRKKFLLKDIESCYPVKNPWYYGWGIHLTPYGWLYNISGFYAVKLNMKTGKKCLIGTDEPKVLANAVDKAVKGIN